MALRFSPACTPGAPVAGDGGVILDATPGWNWGASGGGGALGDGAASPASLASAAGGGGGGALVPKKVLAAKSGAAAAWVNPTGATQYQAALAHVCYRFFDCDMHFSQPALNIMLRALQEASTRDRELFFQATVGTSFYY
jgi:hypothetical protein